MDVVNVILQPVVESLLVPVKKHIDFMTSCKKYVRDMDSSMKELNATRLDVKNHMELNKGSNLEIPAHLPSWLEEVEKVDAEVNSISTNVGSCFSFKTRHEIGKKAFKTIQRIERLTEEHSRIIWTNHPIPLGKVDSIKASTSTPSVEYHGDFESRKETFMKALKALEPDHKSHMIALCGMGGVGKTTMMEKLKTVVKEKGMFSLIIKVVIGEKTDPFAIQDAVADYLSINLKEITSIPARADKLRKWFKNYSEGGKKKILVILDDIWQLVDLNDIGLSPFPDQGVDFKVLLTSRKRDVCTRMGVETKSICNVDLLANAEAQRFFWKFIEDSDEANLDPDLRKLGDDIVSRCQGLPIAIKTIAFALKDNSKCVWEDTRIRLQHHDIDEIMNEVFELSYNNLEDEQTKSVLLLCGLYPEDFDIPTEELVRYGWGLKLFYKVNTIGQARNRLNACVVRLVNANLLIESNGVGSIKMHDLVRAFVLKMFSKAEHASIVNHGSMSEWSVNDTSDSCKRISLACKGMEDFPGDFKYPNLSFLKLTNGDKSLRFPENFYRLMEKLQVIVFEKMQYLLLPGSFEYSTNLRTLCLHECSLMFDFHSIGSLSNLEVLSFANCSIQKLPSTVGNLKELKLLDLTGCVNLHIDDGVLKNLVKLEELYMRVARKKAISFTDGNFNELADRSKSLSAIEIELFRKNAHPKRMSFINLERFKISIGCFLENKYEKTTFENTLMLVSNKGELLESRINVLFEKTDVLHLEVDDMNNLEDFKCSSFHRLRVLNISKCAQLRYLFTCRVASTLSRLEHLEVWSCDTLQTLIHDEDNGSETIRFPCLKFLSSGGLPKLVGLCNTRRVIELPQLMELRLDSLPDFTSIFPDDNLASSSMSSDTSTMKPFLNEEVAIPKLETLAIRRMNKLNKIWSSEVARSENVSFSMLKTIEVEECDRLVDVFPRNPMPLLHHLKQLSVKRCCSIETIFKIDMGCVREGSKSSLVSIVVERSENLRQVWSLKNVEDSSNNRIIHGFEAVESIQILHCDNFRNLSTPITFDFNLEVLQIIDIDYNDGISSAESRPDQQNPIFTSSSSSSKITVFIKESKKLVIPFQVIEKATKNFTTVLGKGGFGIVYKGELLLSGEPTSVAVKRLDRKISCQGFKEFLTEIQLLSRYKHPNLVSLLGFCDEAGEMILIYEYAEHGSLDQHLSVAKTTHPLTWEQRISICLDTARGLDYLHNHIPNNHRVIHRDIKSANILIGHDWKAMIADLGLSKISRANENDSYLITNPSGTHGYCDPAYMDTGILTKESDVYSFGVVMFEVLCGRLCFIKVNNEHRFLARLAPRYYETGRLNEIIDPYLKIQVDSDSLKRFSEIAYLCLLNERDKRPSMGSVVQKLEEMMTSSRVL